MPTDALSPVVCPLCGAASGVTETIETQEAHGKKRCTLVRCGCGLRYLHDLHADRSAIYDERYGAWGAVANGDDEEMRRAKREAFRAQLRALLPYGDASSKRLLDVGTGIGLLLDAAKEMGFDVHGVETSTPAAEKAALRFPGRIFNGMLDAAAYPAEQFDVVTLVDVLEHVDAPDALLGEIARVLRPGGHLLVITPDTDSWSRKLLGARWFQYKYEHVTYWNGATLRTLLARHGFETILLRGNSKRFDLAYYHRYFQKYAFPPFDRILHACYRFLPARVRHAFFTNPLTGEMLAIARRQG